MEAATSKGKRMDIATLGLEVRSDSVRGASRDLDRFTGSARKAEKGTGQLEGGSRRLGAGMRVAAAGIAAAAASALSLQKLARSAQSYTQITNSLRAIGMSSSEAAASLNAIGDIANRTRSPLEATAQLYQRISIAGRDLGASQQQVLDFTENVGLALAQSGTSAQEASGALLQLSQAMSGGTVRAEEFNSILEGAFPIAQAAARGIDAAGGSVGRLRNLVIEGKISSNEFFEAILSQTDQLEAAFANTTPTISQALTVMNNNFTQLVGQMDSGLGVTSAIAEALIFVANNLDRVVAYATAAAVAIGVRYAGAAVIAAARTMTLAGAMTALRTALMRTGFGLLIVAAGELVVQFGRLVRATGGFGSAMAALGDVAGAVWQGIIDSAAAIPPALNGVWEQMKAGFLHALAGMATSFHDFVWMVGSRMSEIPGLEDAGSGLLSLAEGISSASGDLAKAGYDAEAAAAGSFSKAASTIAGAFEPAREKVAELAKTVTEAADAANDIPGGGGGGGLPPGGGGGSGDGESSRSKAAKEAERQAKAIKDVVQGLQDEIAMVGASEVARRTQQELRAAGVDLYSQEGQQIADLVEHLTALEARQQVIDDFSRGFGEAIGQAESFGDAIENIGDLFENTLRRMASQWAEQGMSGLLGQLTGGAGGGGGWMSAIGSALGFGGGGVSVGTVNSTVGALRATAASMDTGGYTGDWSGPGVDGKSGRWGILHPREFVVNEDQVKKGQMPGGKTEIVVRHEEGMLVEIAHGQANSVYTRREAGTINRAKGETLRTIKNQPKSMTGISRG